MTGVVLRLLVGLVPLLAVLAAVAFLAAGTRRRWLGPAMAACGVAVLLLATIALAGGGAAEGFSVKLGFAVAPGAAPSGLRFAIDGLSGFFLLPLGLAMLAGGVWGLGERRFVGRPAESPLPALLAAGLLLALLAADPWPMLFGAALAVLAAILLLGARAGEGAAPGMTRSFGVQAMLGVLCLAAGLVLLSTTAGAGFADIRLAGVDGARGAWAVLLLMVGGAVFAGLAPFHAWLPRNIAGAGPHAPDAMTAILLTAGLSRFGFYVLIRGLFDLAGPAPAIWWALPLLAAGSVGAVLSARQACAATDLARGFGALSAAQNGAIGIGLAVALAARANDLAPLASLALGAVLLQLLAQAVGSILLLLAGFSIEQEAGTRRLDLLGGLGLLMPVTTLCVLVGAMSLVALPPSAGFAGFWLLAQSVVAAPRLAGWGFVGLGLADSGLGGLAVQLCFLAGALALATTMGLALVAGLRLVGIACLGRTRSARAAGAAEARPPARATLVGLAGLLGAIGLFPGAILALAEPTLQQLLGSGLGPRIGWFGIAAGDDRPGYAPVLLIVLLAICLAGCLLLARRWGVGSARHAPAWDGGIAAPPPWMSCGDPLTQAGSADPVAPVAAAFVPPMPPGWAGLRQYFRRPAISAGGLLVGTVLLLLAWLALA